MLLSRVSIQSQQIFVLARPMHRKYIIPTSAGSIPNKHPFVYPLLIKNTLNHSNILRVEFLISFKYGPFHWTRCLNRAHRFNRLPYFSFVDQSKLKECKSEICQQQRCIQNGWCVHCIAPSNLV